MSEEDVKRVHSPIGLSIGAKTAQEIAVAIVAEMVAVKNNNQ
ncbi:MAG: XdhC family protein [Bacillota bacterium]